MSLQSNLTQLLHPHPTRRPDSQIVTAPALLDQLAEAVKPSGSSRSGGGGGGHTPANLDAINLWSKLDTYARIEIQHQQRGATMTGTLGHILNTWRTPTSPDDEALLEDATAHIISEINNLLDPPLPRRKIWQPCPACDTKVIPNDEGDRTACLTAAVWDDRTGRVLHQSEMHLACSHCGAEWSGDSLKGVLEKVANVWAEELEDTEARETTRV